MGACIITAATVLAIACEGLVLAAWLLAADAVDHDPATVDLAGGETS